LIAFRADTVASGKKPFIRPHLLGLIQIKEAQAMEVELNQIAMLRSEHQLIDLMAGELAAFIGERERPEPVRFLNFRREFGRALSLHLKREDWVVYPRLRAHARREVRDLASPFCAASAAFSRVFEAYSRAWTSVSIASDWKGFQAATEVMLDHLHNRIAMEENQLYPLLASGRETQSLRWTNLFSPRSGAAPRQRVHREVFSVAPGGPLIRR
jgi:hemerythrin-like domain-containing protein